VVDTWRTGRGGEASRTRFPASWRARLGLHGPPFNLTKAHLQRMTVMLKLLNLCHRPGQGRVTRAGAGSGAPGAPGAECPFHTNVAA
jgi:hypothetical protein